MMDDQEVWECETGNDFLKEKVSLVVTHIEAIGYINKNGMCMMLTLGEAIVVFLSDPVKGKPLTQ